MHRAHSGDSKYAADAEVSQFGRRRRSERKEHLKSHAVIAHRPNVPFALISALHNLALQSHQLLIVCNLIEYVSLSDDIPGVNLQRLDGRCISDHPEDGVLENGRIISHHRKTERLDGPSRSNRLFRGTLNPDTVLTILQVESLTGDLISRNASDLDPVATLAKLKDRVDR
jgi:hypothetical protein